ncbi:MAG TPA: sulfatase-like hydrolase/transferase [Bryobacteraceae bacterium]|nr:sulfatase-like hydrolase/transferase [Bryobacteraceae bacterium]
MPLSRRALFGLPFAAALAQPRRRPNIIVFMTDDHGAWATGAYGCAEAHTPNIDALAKGGAKFTRAFACTPVCSPSRMTYVTGCVPSVHSVQDWLRPEDSFGPTAQDWLAGLTTYPELLAKAGYQCGMVGKWHMGHDEKAQRGFTYWATVPGGGGTFKDAVYVKNGVTTPYPGFKEDAIGDFALEFLKQQKQDTPFYLHVPFYAPHTPFDFQPEEDRKHYANATLSCFPDTPQHPNQNPGIGQHHGKSASKSAYLALITGADRNIGRVLRALEERGWRENTLVVFTADQGYNAGHHGVWGKGNGTWPFNMYEESIRVPMIWNHPGTIKPGTSVTSMVSSYDFFPSVLDYAGVSAPPDKRRLGHSYTPFLRGQKPRWEDKLFFEYSYVRGVRTPMRKLVLRAEGFPSEFYDLEKDPGEKENRIDNPAYAKEIKALRGDMEQWFQRTGAPPLDEWRKTTRQNLTKYGAFPAKK